MICVKTNLKASLWLAFSIYIETTKRSDIHTKTAKLYKMVWPSKSLGEKSCEITRWHVITLLMHKGHQ